MESFTKIQVGRNTFNKFRPVMLDDQGNFLQKDITTEDIDAYGFIEVRGIDGNIAKIMLCFDRGD